MTESPDNQNIFSVKVQADKVKIEISIPLNSRSHIGMGDDGSGKAAVDIAEQLLNKIKEYRKI